MPKLIGEAIGLGAVAGLVGGAYKFGEFLLKTRRLLDVGAENEVFVRLIQRVRKDLTEVQRLLRVPTIQRRLVSQPEKQRWVEVAVRDTVAALAEIGRFTERVTRDTERGKWVGIRNRIRWVLDENEALKHRRLELATCHQSLAGALAFLAPFEPLDEEKMYEYERSREQEEQRHFEGRVEFEREPERIERVETRVETEREPRERVYEKERVIYEDAQPPRERVYEEERAIYEKPLPSEERRVYNDEDARYRDYRPEEREERRYAEERVDYEVGPRPLRYAQEDRDQLRYGVPRQRWGGDLDQTGFGDVEVVEKRYTGPIDQEYERVIRRERHEEYVPDPRPMRLRVHQSKL